MKKLFVFSDTHRNSGLISSLQNIMLECDYVIHLGDYVSDTDSLKPLLNNRLICVRGNGDFFTWVPDEKEVEIDGVKLLLTHGHRYNVKNTLVNIGDEALRRECAAVLYGHTHLCQVTDYAGIKLINPGSFHAPRTGVCSYCYIIIWKGKIIPKIVEI
jgi:putative phosphoesterase